MQPRACRCRSRAKATGPIDAWVRPRPRPITRRPTGFAHGRRSHLRQGLRPPSFPNGSVPFLRRFIGLIGLSTVALRIGRPNRQSPGWIDDLYDARARQAVHDLYPEGILVPGVNNSLCCKRGLTIFGTGMHHEPTQS